MMLLVIATFFLSQALGDVTRVVTSRPSEYEMVASVKEDGDIGEPNEIQSHPWLASIQNGERHVCAGSVISPALVLTAARCAELEPAQLSVRVGCSIAQRGGSVHRVAHVRRHEGHDGSDPGDVALLKVEPPFELGRDVGTIGYANRGDRLSANSSALVAGWAADSHRFGSMLLRSAELLVVEEARCPSGRALEERICVASPPGRGPVCQGDPGAPLVADGLQFGVVPSSGLGGCASAGRPRLVTSVARYRAWIDDTAKILEGKRKKMSVVEFMEKYILPMFWPFNQF